MRRRLRVVIRRALPRRVGTCSVPAVLGFVPVRSLVVVTVADGEMGAAMHKAEKKDSDSGRVLTLATEDLPCGEGGEYEVSDSGAVT